MMGFFSDDWMDRRRMARVPMSDMNNDRSRCIGLVGDVGSACSCKIYDRRPSVCREFAPGSGDCLASRRKAGLPDLSNADEQDTALQPSPLQRVVDFLREIGLSVEIESGASGFLPHCRIEKGTLLVDPRCPVSNLLHEAGHLATIPPVYRPWMDDDLEAGIGRMLDDAMSRDLHPDDPFCRAVMQASDPEATAWAWAVGKHLGLPEELIILDSEYDGAGDAIRLGLRNCAYIGINGLAHAGFCAVRISYSGLPVYPALARWIQDAAPPEDHSSMN
jgi:hypothetical protein